MSEISDKAEALENEAGRILDDLTVGTHLGTQVSPNAARFVDCIVMAAVLRVAEMQREALTLMPERRRGSE